MSVGYKLVCDVWDKWVWLGTSNHKDFADSELVFSFLKEFHGETLRVVKEDGTGDSEYYTVWADENEWTDPHGWGEWR